MEDEGHGFQITDSAQTMYRARRAAPRRVRWQFAPAGQARMRSDPLVDEACAGEPERLIVPAVDSMLADVRACTLCAGHLPHGPRPVLQLHPAARILIAAQAPGRKVHESGIPFDDASGDRLRRWLGVTAEAFYNPRLFAIVPMGLCYPGKGSSGDLPPRPECAPRWRRPLLATLHSLKLTLVVGQYAASYHLPQARSGLTDSVRNWRLHWPDVVPLPHPSPTNNRWLARNRWFEAELVPELQALVAQVLRE